MFVLMVMVFAISWMTNRSDLASVLLVPALKGSLAISTDIQLITWIIHTQVHDSQETKDVQYMMAYPSISYHD